MSTYTACCGDVMSRDEFKMQRDRDMNNSCGKASILTFKNVPERSSMTELFSSTINFLKITKRKPKPKSFDIQIKNGYEFKNALEHHLFPTSVEDIILTRTNIQFIPVSIGRFSNLKNLILNNNDIIEIPWSMIYLKHLTVLDLSNNNLPDVPSMLGYLSSLRELYVRKNKLVYLPTSLLKLTHLEILDVSQNPHLLGPRPVICSRGKDAIFSYLMQRQNRVNVFAGATSWYDEAWAKNLPDGCRVMPVESLLQMAIDCVIDCQIDYMAPSHLPPLLKNFLFATHERLRSQIAISKCNACGAFFTSVDGFRNHDCR